MMFEFIFKDNIYRIIFIFLILILSPRKLSKNCTVLIEKKMTIIRNCYFHCFVLYKEFEVYGQKWIFHDISVKHKFFYKTQI